MSEDPAIQAYADLSERQWGLGELSSLPMFKAFPKPTRDPQMIEQYLSEWKREDGDARCRAPDGSGFHRYTMQSMESPLRDKSTVEMDYWNTGAGENIMVGPRGGRLRVTEDGQRVGSELLNQLEEEKSRAGEFHSRYQSRDGRPLGGKGTARFPFAPSIRQALADLQLSEAAKQAQFEQSLARLRQDSKITQEQEEREQEQQKERRSSKESIRSTYNIGEELPAFARRNSDPIESPLASLRQRGYNVPTPPRRDRNDTEPSHPSNTSPTPRSASHTSRIPPSLPPQSQ